MAQALQSDTTPPIAADADAADAYLCLRCSHGRPPHAPWTSPTRPASCPACGSYCWDMPARDFMGRHPHTPPRPRLHTSARIRLNGRWHWIATPSALATYEAAELDYLRDRQLERREKMTEAWRKLAQRGEDITGGLMDDAGRWLAEAPEPTMRQATGHVPTREAREARRQRKRKSAALDDNVSVKEVVPTEADTTASSATGATPIVTPATSPILLAPMPVRVATVTPTTPTAPAPIAPPPLPPPPRLVNRFNDAPLPPPPRVPLTRVEPRVEPPQPEREATRTLPPPPPQAAPPQPPPPLDADLAWEAERMEDIERGL